LDFERPGAYPQSERHPVVKEERLFAEAEAAGIVLGARVPVILTSRADNVRARIASCGVAALYTHTRRETAACHRQDAGERGEGCVRASEGESVAPHGPSRHSAMPIYLDLGQVSCQPATFSPHPLASPRFCRGTSRRDGSLTLTENGASGTSQPSRHGSCFSRGTGAEATGRETPGAPVFGSGRSLPGVAPFPPRRSPLPASGSRRKNNVDRYNCP